MNEDFNLYLERSGIGDDKYLTSHCLIDFEKNRMLFKRKYIDKAIEKKETPALKFGRAFHMSILEPEKFDKSYTSELPINEKTGKFYGLDTNRSQDYLKEIGKDYIDAEDMNIIKSIKKNLTKEALEIINGSEKEQTAFGKILDINCQIRKDLCGRGYVADLKTTADMDRFLRDADKFGYWTQAGFYSLVDDVEIYSWIVCETVEPFEVVVYQPTRVSIKHAKECVKSSVEELKKCLKSGVFSNGREGTISVMHPDLEMGV